VPQGRADAKEQHRDGWEPAELAEEVSAMFAYFRESSYVGPEAKAKIAAARDVATGPFTDLATWARQAMPAGSS
jgi:hypothetical protein